MLATIEALRGKWAEEHNMIFSVLLCIFAGKRAHVSATIYKIDRAASHLRRSNIFQAQDGAGSRFAVAK